MRQKYRLIKHPGSWSLQKEIDGKWKEQGLREYHRDHLLRRIQFSVGNTIEIEIRESED